MAEKTGSPRPRDEHGRFLSKDQTEEPTAEEPTAQKTEQEDEWVEDISDTVAPSVGPGSVVVHHAHPEAHPSTVDAMGQDKRRQVVGKTYGPTFARQAALYGIFLVVVVAIGFGIKVAVDHFDKPQHPFPPKAAWARSNAPQIPPKPLQ
jgi:hypothetical protein